MKVIVFGGTGWVGHNIAIYCDKAGYEVTVCSRGKKTDYNANIPAGVRIIQGDKRDDARMAEIFQEAYDIVIDSVPDDGKVMDNILKYGRGLKRYLHCSSVMSYAPLPFVPGDETMPFDEYMVYGRTKKIVDSRAIDLCRQGKLQATVIRPSYITGAGRFPIDNCGGRREDFIGDILAGKTLDLPNDGMALLHPVHAKDVAHSFLLALQHPASVGQIYNLCGDKALTITRYLEITAAALDRKIDINYLPLEEMAHKYKDKVDRAGLCFFAEHMCYDITKARTELEYVPQYSTAEAIEETVRWVTEQD